jgi:hypothetical protein
MKKPTKAELDLRAGRSAEAFGELLDTLPPGSHLAVFVIADLGDAFEAMLAATLPPDRVAPILRTWLERYERGETTPAPGGH